MIFLKKWGTISSFLNWLSAAVLSLVMILWGILFIIKNNSMVVIFSVSKNVVQGVSTSNFSLVLFHVKVKS